MIERAALTLAGKIAPGYANLYMASGSALSLIEDAAKAIEEKDAEIAALREAALCEKAERYGEQRAVELIVRWLRESGYQDDLAFADAIERGEWKEEP